MADPKDSATAGVVDEAAKAIESVKIGPPKKEVTRKEDNSPATVDIEVVWPSWIKLVDPTEEMIKAGVIPKGEWMLDMDLEDFDRCFDWGEPVPALPNKIDTIIPEYASLYSSQQQKGTVYEDMVRLHILPEVIPTPALFLALHAGTRANNKEGIMTVNLQSQFAAPSKKLGMFQNAYSVYKVYTAIFHIYNNLIDKKNTEELKKMQNSLKEMITERRKLLYFNLQDLVRKGEGYAFARQQVKRRDGAFGFAVFCDPTKDKIGYEAQKKIADEFAPWLRAYIISTLRLLESAFLACAKMRDRKGAAGSLRGCACPRAWETNFDNLQGFLNAAKEARKVEIETWAEYVDSLCIPQTLNKRGVFEDLEEPNDKRTVGPPYHIDKAAIKATRSKPGETTTLGWFSYYQVVELLLANEPFTKHQYVMEDAKPAKK